MLTKLLRGILVIGWLWAGLAIAVSSEFTEGKHYNKLPIKALENPLVDELKKEIKPGQVKVIEFFSYGCVWCYRLDPALAAWLKTKPDYIQFERVPVVFQASWKDLTRTYYTAEALQALDKIHEPLFRAIHTEKLDMTQQGALKTFFVNQGIEAKSFDDTFGSFTIERKLKWAESIGQLFKVTRIPALVVLTPEAAYLSTVSMAGNEENLIKLVNQFAQEAQEKSKTQGA
ncbi:MAG: thiol:disulfide interchange protein DsbA/DsbL [Gammaproteobacteria bacterium]